MPKNNSLCQYRDKISNKMISYIDLDTLKKEHPEGDYSIVGEIDIKSKHVDGVSKKLLGNDIYIYIKSIGDYSEKRYKTIGYIPCENSEYVILKKIKYERILSYVLVPFLAIIMAILLMFLYGNFVSDKNNSKGIGVDPNAGKYESLLKRPDNIDDSKILIPGYGKFTIKKGSNIIDTVLFNPDGNPCYFQFTLLEKDSGEILYKSKLVPPNQGIRPIKLNKVFNKVGTYKAILKFNTIDFENTDIQYNGSDIAVDLNVVE